MTSVGLVLAGMVAGLVWWYLASWHEREALRRLPRGIRREARTSPLLVVWSVAFSVLSMFGVEPGLTAWFYALVDAVALTWLFDIQVRMTKALMQEFLKWGGGDE